MTPLPGRSSDHGSIEDADNAATLEAIDVPVALAAAIAAVDMVDVVDVSVSWEWGVSSRTCPPWNTARRRIVFQLFLIMIEGRYKRFSRSQIVLSRS